jgi:outer membrane biosynthesis protein TonB
MVRPASAFYYCLGGLLLRLFLAPHLLNPAEVANQDLFPGVAAKLEKSTETKETKPKQNLKSTEEKQKSKEAEKKEIEKKEENKEGNSKKEDKSEEEGKKKEVEEKEFKEDNKDSEKKELKKEDKKKKKTKKKKDKKSKIEKKKDTEKKDIVNDLYPYGKNAYDTVTEYYEALEKKATEGTGPRIKEGEDPYVDEQIAYDDLRAVS